MSSSVQPEPQGRTAGPPRPPLRCLVTGDALHGAPVHPQREVFGRGSLTAGSSVHTHVAVAPHKSLPHAPCRALPVRELSQHSRRGLCTCRHGSRHLAAIMPTGEGGTAGPRDAHNQEDLPRGADRSCFLSVFLTSSNICFLILL